MLFAYFITETDGDNIKKSHLLSDTDIRCHKLKITVIFIFKSEWYLSLVK